jgi:flagellar biosynthetic protein FliS
MQSTELSYRKAAAESATGIGLLIALYDTLAGNLRRAADAERCNDLEKRCLEVNHALMVVGYLEDCIQRASEGDLATQLVSLYSSLRRKLIEAQAKRSPEILEQQMERVLTIRECWQAMEHSTSDAQARVEHLGLADHESTGQSFESQTANWSA